MAFSIKNLFAPPEVKSVPLVSLISEQTRDGVNKTYIPQFLYRPPFGYPRHSNIPQIRRLAQTPYVEMCIRAILDEISSTEWDIVVREDKIKEYTDEGGEILESKRAEIQHVKDFLNNPNTNDETFEEVFVRRFVRDMLEVNTGVLVKVFNNKEEMVEVVSRDGGSFTMNPDVHGMFTDREDFIMQDTVVMDKNPVMNPFLQISSNYAREKAAYFQYGFTGSPSPIPYGKREVVMCLDNPRGDNIYGSSIVESLYGTLVLLKWQVEADLEYYNDNNVPKGFMSLEGASTEQIKSFSQQWTDQMRTTDELGNVRKSAHRIPAINVPAVFNRIAFSSDELQVLEKQQWYFKHVVGMFGLTMTELGFTEDAKGSANQIVQSKIAKKRAIHGRLRKIADMINRRILPEFEYEDLEFKYLIKDTDEERNRWELYKLQKEVALTPNEIRRDEGLDPIDGGDDLDKPSSNNPFGFQEENGKDPRDFQERNEDAEDTSEVDGKGLGVDSPLLIQGNERPSSVKLQKELLKKLKEAEKEILSFIRREVKVSGKSFSGLVDRLKAIFSIESLRSLTDLVIKGNFLNGWEEGEKELDMNFVPNEEAIRNLQEHTFGNIKDMTEEIANDLRQVLERGLINQEGVSKLTPKVKDIFKSSTARAEMIARTETSRALNQGKLKSYIESGEKIKKYISIVDDDRTSQVSKAMFAKYGSAEKAIPLDKEFSVTVNGKDYSGLTPPFMPNDRDTVLFTV